MTKRSIAAALIVVALGLGAVVVANLREKAPKTPVEPVSPTTNKMTHEVIGRSVEGRDITAYHYGTGNTELLFVGGIHGGYEWNSVMLAYQFMDYVERNPGVIPANIAVTVIPSANPDGVYNVVGKEGRFTKRDVSTEQRVLESGRFNARGVDLNRNFDCKWKPTSTWRSVTVSGGIKAFSEPEAAALRNFVLAHAPRAVILWHSQANAVYPAECGGAILSETRDLMEAYARAAGYQALESFDAYDVTGAADGWFASIGIPAITVELKTHETIEWEQNLAGIRALFGYYGQKRNP